MSPRMGTSPRFLSACFVTTSSFFRLLIPNRRVRSMGRGGRLSVDSSLITLSFHCFQFFASMGERRVIRLPSLVSVSRTSRAREPLRSAWKAYL